jgi:hypothetical protein
MNNKFSHLTVLHNELVIVGEHFFPSLNSPNFYNITRLDMNNQVKCAILCRLRTNRLFSLINQELLRSSENDGPFLYKFHCTLPTHLMC